MVQFPNRPKLDRIAPFLIFAVALLPRIASLGAFITWDEPMWVYRSIHFLSALLQGDFVGTRLVGHPGVTTMLSGAIGVAVRRALMGNSAADIAWVNTLPALEPTNVAAMRKLAPFLPAAKLPLVVLHAAAVVGMYLLLRRLLDVRTAGVAAVLIALDPFHIALSRVLHIDGAASDFMLLSVLVLLFSLHNRRELVLLSGALAGLAFLTKSYALFLGPFVALVLGAFATVRREPMQRAATAFLGWCLVAGMVCLVLWPAMWVDPVGTVRSVLDTAFGYAGTLSETSEFFMGHVVEDAGLWFYPVALAFRMTPLVLLGLLAFFVWAVRAVWRSIARGTLDLSQAVLGRWLPMFVLVAYACLFCVSMTLATEKFDRYMLPTMLALDILAAIGLARCTEHAKRNLASALLIALLLAQGVWIVSYHPYYFAYYNPLVGGSRVAPQIMPLGWGEGMDLAAGYLNDKDHAQDLAVATAGIPGFASFFDGRVEPLTQHGVAMSDYAVLYVSDVQQKSPSAEMLSAQQPETVIRIHGIDYAWLYPNEARARLVSSLQNRAASREAVVTDATSGLDRDLPGVLRVSDGQTEAAVAAQLRSIATARQYLNYVHFPEADVEGWIKRQLAVHALLVGRESIGLAEVSRYFLPSGTTFGAVAVRADTDVRFGDKLRLAGYALDSDRIQYRQQLGVVLVWQKARPLAENYAVSLHLLDGRGYTWAKQDSWLLNAAGSATSAWAADETVREDYLLPIPAGIPPGPYQLSVTIYDTQNLAPVPVLDQTGAMAGTEHSVAMLMVVPATFPATPEEVSIPHALNRDLGQLQLLGFDLASEAVTPGQKLELGLFWRALQPAEQDLTQALRLRDQAGRVWSEATSAVSDEYYPLSAWRAGEVLHRRYQLRIDPAVPSGIYDLVVGVSGTQGRDATLVELAVARLTVHAREHLMTTPEIRYPVQARVGDVAMLVGYDLDRLDVEAGGALQLTLYWQPLAQTEHEYKVFTHLVDAQNRIWGQQDGIPCLGACGTMTWIEGEFIVDSYAIKLDPEAPASDYWVGVGMYDPATMQRLPALDVENKRWSDDRIVLPGRIAVRHAGG